MFDLPLRFNAIAIKQGRRVWIPAHEIAEQFIYGLAETRSQHLLTELAANFFIKNALLLESRKAVSIKNLCPLVGVIH